MTGRSRNFVFTLNNYNDTDCKILMEPKKGVRFLQYGKEMGEKNNTPHLQGFICYNNPKTFKQTKTWFKKLLKHERLHIEKMNGSIEDNLKYTSKEGNIYKYGDPPLTSNKGKRNDLQIIRDVIKSNKLTKKEIIDQYGNNYQQIQYINSYFSNFQEIKMETEYTKEMKNIQLRDYQDNWLKHLLNQDNRKVLFIVDKIGNSGKSTFSKYLDVNYNVLLTTGGKTKDLSYLVKDQEILVYDCPRSIEEINYHFIECLKNGFITSTKYEVVQKRFKPFKIVVLTNKSPDMESLSKDRYEIINVEENKKTEEIVVEI